RHAVARDAGRRGAGDRLGQDDRAARDHDELLLVVDPVAVLVLLRLGERAGLAARALAAGGGAALALGRRELLARGALAGGADAAGAAAVEGAAHARAAGAAAAEVPVTDRLVGDPVAVGVDHVGDAVPVGVDRAP